MERWAVAEMHELARAIVAAGDSFFLRRLLQRHERGELGLDQVVRCIEYSISSSNLRIDMNIGVDESGSFVYTEKENSWSCVVAYVYPETNTRRLRSVVDRLVRAHAQPGHREVKLRDLNEESYLRFLGRLNELDGVLYAVATNAATSTPEELRLHQEEQAKKIVEHVDKMIHESGKASLRALAERVAGLSSQLYVQMIAQVQLVIEILHSAPLYFVQRYPPALGKFRWRIDQKASTRTEYELAYTTVLPGLLQTASLREPMPMLEGADYRWFERHYYPRGKEPTYLRDVYGIEAGDAADRKFNIGQIVREDVRFVDSQEDASVQVADLLASGVRRCLRGEFKDNYGVASSLGRLMVQRGRKEYPIKLIALGVVEDVPVDDGVAEVAEAMKRHARPMLY